MHASGANSCHFYPRASCRVLRDGQAARTGTSCVSISPRRGAVLHKKGLVPHKLLDARCHHQPGFRLQSKRPQPAGKRVWSAAHEARGAVRTAPVKGVHSETI